MILTLELPPELEERLEAKAQVHGQDVRTFALAVLQREAKSGADLTSTPSPLAQALALSRELSPVIKAGTRQSDKPLDAAADLTALREERWHGGSG